MENDATLLLPFRRAAASLAAAELLVHFSNHYGDDDYISVYSTVSGALLRGWDLRGQLWATLPTELRWTWDAEAEEWLTLDWAGQSSVHLQLQVSADGRELLLLPVYRGWKVAETPPPAAVAASRSSAPADFHPGFTVIVVSAEDGSFVRYFPAHAGLRVEHGTRLALGGRADGAQRCYVGKS